MEFLLSDDQFGFRVNKSTVDVLIRVRNLTSNVVTEGGVAIAVGLDITNAFNSIPWSVILSAMEKKGIPAYLRRSVGDYLSYRSVVYKTIEGSLEERSVRASFRRDRSLALSCGTWPLIRSFAYDWRMDVLLSVTLMIPLSFERLTDCLVRLLT